jgi:hypothetical protein
VSHGSLIVTVLAKKSMAVCADRRVMQGDFPVDTAQKVFPVGRNGIYAASGTTRILLPREMGGRSLDVHALVQDYFRGKAKLVVADIVQGLSRELGAGARRVFGAIDPRQWVQVAGAPEEDLFRVVVFLAKDGRFASVDMTCRLSVAEFLITPTMLHKVKDVYSDRFQVIGGTGTPEMGRQLLDASDETWSDLRADPLMAHVLLSRTNIQKTMSAEDAERFARMLIGSVSERKHKLGFADDVSPESDCFHLSRGGKVWQ